ncbi:unnamed protein product [Mytilus edulis]|uniref:Uncharacterized protein n=1 Tax=Mytilus edulis TaxID=6550 RepID=A0A8S3RGK0_MYTED|nr:unnamed protein product [Mytilus edulis]
MFVMTEDNIKDYAENTYECLGIVLPEDLLLQYIIKWFPRKNTTTSSKEFLNDNRLLMNDTFRNALRTFMNDSKTELIASLIQNSSIDIFNTVFVMTEDEIKDNAENRYECFGLVIADNMLQTALRTYFKQLNTEDIEAPICTGGRDFLNKMFVMTKEDIKDKIDNQFECFGIVIPCHLLQQYIEKLMDDILPSSWYYCKRNSKDRKRG